MRKNIVIFFGKENGNNIDPLNFYGKKETYKKLINKIYQKGGEVFVCRGIDKVSNNIFFHTGWNWKYNQRKFVRTDAKYIASAVLDRSAALSYPIDNENSSKILNSIELKTLCKDKFKTYQFLQEFCPKTQVVHSRKEAELVIKKNFSNKECVIIKPSTGIKGIGIKKIRIKNINEELPEINTPYLIQEFLDSSVGIPKLVNGIHDLRIAFIKDEIVFAHIRQPAKGMILANVAQGGSLTEIQIDKIPQDFLKTAKTIREKIESVYGKRTIFSTDLANTNEGVKLIELSNDLGFPRDKALDNELFTEKLTDLLIEIAYQ